MEPQLIVKLKHLPAPVGSMADPARLGLPSASLSGFQATLASEGLVAVPLRRPGPDLTQSPTRLLEAARPPRRMDRYWQVPARVTRFETLRARLAALPEIESAVILPAPEVPAVPDFSPRQAYRAAAPDGVDVAHAWGIEGGRGGGIRVIDIEGDWQLDHEDLVGSVQSPLSVFADPAANWGGRHDIFLHHGTAVLGQMAARDNGFGVTGMAPDAAYGVVSHMHHNFWGTPIGAAGAIARASDLLGPGDIMLLEMHQPGPRFGFQAPDGQRGFICVEWWEPIFDAIKDATDNGIVVVEAAGNGSENLDDAIYDVNSGGFSIGWRNPFRRASDESDSGAILVGAGAPATVHSGSPRSRLGFSNHGAVLDCQGWGASVVTCGYGDLRDTGPTGTYTATFGGTSSASPIVAGALACVQGILRARGLPLLTPARARTLLRATGSPQQWPHGHATTDRIGNLPDLRALVAAAIAQAGHAPIA